MKTCHYYWLVEPVRGGLRDRADAKPAFEITINAKERACRLALFTDESNLPAYGRLTIPGLAAEQLPEELLPLIQEAKEHLLSALRFGWHQEVTYFPRAMWSFTDADQPQNVDVAITFHGEMPFDADKTRQVLVAGFPFRVELRLFVDFADSRIPLQYRFLSGYKIIELEFKSKGKWNKAELKEFLKPYEAAAANSGVPKRLDRYLHALRDKCAHIRTGKDVFGVTHLSNKQAAEVEQFLPLLGEIALGVINRRGGTSFALHKGPVPLSPSQTSAN